MTVLARIHGGIFEEISRGLFGEIAQKNCDRIPERIPGGIPGGIAGGIIRGISCKLSKEIPRENPLGNFGAISLKESSEEFAKEFTIISRQNLERILERISGSIAEEISVGNS